MLIDVPELLAMLTRNSTNMRANMAVNFSVFHRCRWFSAFQELNLKRL